MGLLQATEKAETSVHVRRSGANAATPELLPTADKAGAPLTRSGDAQDELKSVRDVLTAKNTL
jgi:hypothetical protein